MKDTKWRQFSRWLLIYVYEASSSQYAIIVSNERNMTQNDTHIYCSP